MLLDVQHPLAFYLAKLVQSCTSDLFLCHSQLESLLCSVCCLEVGDQQLVHVIQYFSASWIGAGVDTLSILFDSEVICTSLRKI